MQLATCKLEIKMLASESEAQLVNLVICVLESQRKLSVVFPSEEDYTYLRSLLVWLSPFAQE